MTGETLNRRCGPVQSTMRCSADGILKRGLLVTIDYDFLAKRYNRDHGTKYRSGIHMVSDLYEKYGAYGVANRLIVNHKSIYNFLKKNGSETFPRGSRKRMTDKKDRVLKAINHGTARKTLEQIARECGVSESLVRYYKKRVFLVGDQQ